MCCVCMLCQLMVLGEVGHNGRNALVVAVEASNEDHVIVIALLQKMEAKLVMVLLKKDNSAIRNRVQV